MANPVVHFEITGTNPKKLQHYYKNLFGWETNTDSSVAPEISGTGEYGFIDKIPADEEGTGIPGGIGGGAGFENKLIVYVGVSDVETALDQAEKMGGKRLLGPIARPDGGVVVGHFTDPEGNLIGVAGPK